MKNVTKNFAELIKTEGMDTLGWLVHYKIGDFEMPHKDFTNLLKKSGIDPKLAPVISARNAAIRAVHDFAVEKAKQKGSRQDQVFYKNVLDNETEMVLMVLNLEVDTGASDVDLGDKIRVSFNKATKSLSVQNATAAQEKEIQDLFDSKKGMYTEDQFRSFTLRFIQQNCKSISAREGGGIYFVPSTDKENLDVLQGLFDAIPQKANASLVEIPIIDTQKARNSMWQAMVDDVKGELDVLQKEFEDNKAEMTEKKLQTRIEKYTNLKARINTYEFVLRDNADALSERLTKLTKAAQTRLGLG